MALQPFVVSGREIKGWICQLKRKTLDNQSETGPSGKEFTESYVCGLKFPGGGWSRGLVSGDEL